MILNHGKISLKRKACFASVLIQSDFTTSMRDYILN